MSKRLALLLVTALLSAVHPASGLATPPTKPGTRREVVTSAWKAAVLTVAGATIASSPLPPARAAEDNQALSDAEMEARVARKMALLKAAKSPNKGATGSATDIRSDINPQAGIDLRSRSAGENFKMALEKQKEMKNRDGAQKRDDLCEMLGRGC